MFPDIAFSVLLPYGAICSVLAWCGMAGLHGLLFVAGVVLHLCYVTCCAGVL